MEQSKLAHSFSSLELFGGDFGCPKKYYHLRVAKTHKDQGGIESIAGDRDHKGIEDRLAKGTALPDHLKKHEKTIETILNSGVEVKAEQELAITRELIPCDWWHQDVFLRVKADVGLYTETTAGLLDWKTGKRRPKPFQLELGALAQWIHYPKIKSTRAAFLWLKDDATDNYLYTKEDDYDRILSKLKVKADKIEDTAAEGVWQAKPSRFKCKYCPVKLDCSYSMAED